MLKSLVLVLSVSRRPGYINGKVIFVWVGFRLGDNYKQSKLLISVSMVIEDRQSLMSLTSHHTAVLPISQMTNEQTAALLIQTLNGRDSSPTWGGERSEAGV